MRLTFKLFALLDLISIVFLAMQIWTILTHVSDVRTDTFSLVKITLTILIFLSLFLTTAGLYTFKKYGLITYYIQFPFRLFLLVFSIGFITLLPEFFNLGDQFFSWLFRLCVMAEFFRLYYTILAYKTFIPAKQ
ncbi:MAG: hypothetical protein JWQ28_943 [Pedobacter sp.]|jgi:hypothetical protein|nr:hypothetical protein [Pedobacter sp.]